MPRFHAAALLMLFIAACGAEEEASVPADSGLEASADAQADTLAETDVAGDAVQSDSAVHDDHDGGDATIDTMPPIEPSSDITNCSAYSPFGTFEAEMQCDATVCRFAIEVVASAAAIGRGRDFQLATHGPAFESDGVMTSTGPGSGRILVPATTEPFRYERDFTIEESWRSGPIELGLSFVDFRSDGSTCGLESGPQW